MSGRVRAPWVIQGCKVDWAVLNGVPTDCSPLVSVTSLDDKAVFSLASDTGCFDRNQELLDGIISAVKGGK